jgi:restriction system protein
MMTVLDAVERVLREAGEPLHYRDVAQRIVDRKLLGDRADDIDGTVNASVSADLRKFGDGSRFRRTKRGFFGLSTWPEFDEQDGITEQVLDSSPVSDENPAETHSDLRPSFGGLDSAPASAARALSLTDAAEQVLDRFSRRRPMHYRTITEKARELGLIDTASRTPEATLYASIYQEMNRSQRRGDTPRFVLHGRGYF